MAPSANVMHKRFVADRDLYALLDLKPTANFAEIRAAYRRAALLAHPDKGGSKEAFHAIKIAFDALSRSTSRSVYERGSAGRLYRFSPVPSKCRPRPGVEEAALRLKRHRRCSHASQITSARSVAACFHQKAQQKVAAVDRALKNVCALLQSMTVSQRLNSIQSLALPVRASLAAFMRDSQKTKPPTMLEDPAVRGSHAYRQLNRIPFRPGVSGVRTSKSSSGTRYRAHLVIRGLRLYTNTSVYEAAIDQHIVFVQMRSAISAESARDPHIWTDPEKLLAIMWGVLDGNCAFVDENDIHVFVYMRAAKWLDNKTYIVSPVMQIKEAVQLYVRLLSAQGQSWERLRAEWAQVLQCKRSFQAKRLSQADAEAMIDKARQTGLRYHFGQAVRNFERATKQKSIAVKKARVAAVREQRQLATSRAKAKVLERKLLMQRRRLWQCRRKQQKRWSDMTVDDLVHRTHVPH